MTEDEQRFWDAAFVAYVSGIVSDPAVTSFGVNEIENCAKVADLMLGERRRRTQKTSASA